MTRLTPAASTAQLAIGVTLGLSLLTLTACGSQSSRASEPRGDDSAVLQSKVAQSHPDDTTDLTDATRGLRDLGHDLSLHLPASSGNGGNQVFSPASLAIAFAMLREGAGAKSAAEIDQIIGLPENRQAAYNRIVDALTDVGPGDTLEVNDALFLDPELSVHGAYLDAIKRWYGAGLHQTEFPTPALDDINGWVKERTHNRIPKLLDDLDPSAVFALVNTIYLNAKWAAPFNPSKTQDADFTTGTGRHVTVKMMHNETGLDYARGDGWQAVRLPYAGGKLSMWVLIPDGSGDPQDLLAADVLASAATTATPTRVDLSLPRWDTETKAQLVPLLHDLGMDSTFQSGGQFPGITDDPRFFVSQVVQQANITVGEKGTEAAAATAIVGEVTAVMPQGVPVVADHPFAYAIVHDQTGVPLFEGVVSDPGSK